MRSSRELETAERNAIKLCWKQLSEERKTGARESCQGKQTTMQKHMSPHKHQIASTAKANQYSNQYISPKSNPHVNN